MKTIAPITYRFLVCHIAPGLLALYPTKFFSDTVNRLISIAIGKDSCIGTLLALTAIAMVIGLIIDGLRFVTLDYLIDIIREKIFKQRVATCDFDCLEDYNFFDRVQSLNQAWKQFYGNCSFVLLSTSILSILFADLNLSKGILFTCIVTAITLLIAGAKASCNNERELELFFRKKCSVITKK